jgi:feruloyl esterase
MPTSQGSIAWAQLLMPSIPICESISGAVESCCKYHGWSDESKPPRNSINYYTRVQKTVGDQKNVTDSYRLFMIPGMYHCGGGDGPNTFDLIRTLEQWVENGKAPDRIIGSRWNHDKVDRTRPLCPYPQVAKYKGTGSTDDATNFFCALPE